MKQKNKMLSTHGIKTLFETRLTQLTSLASESQDETAFKTSWTIIYYPVLFTILLPQGKLKDW